MSAIYILNRYYTLTIDGQPQRFENTIQVNFKLQESMYLNNNQSKLYDAFWQKIDLPMLNNE